MNDYLEAPEDHCKCGAPALVQDLGETVFVGCANRDEICEYGKPSVMADTRAEAVKTWRERDA